MHPKDEDGIYLKYYQTYFRNWDKQAEIDYNNNEIRQKGRSEFFALAFDYLSDNQIQGDYMEFGCHKARTFRMALSEARRKNFDFMNFWAFDSFEGMPEMKDNDTMDGHLQKGDLYTSLERFKELINAHGLYLDKINYVKGFYEDSLSNSLAQAFISKNIKSCIINIDCCIYQASSLVLDFIIKADLLQDGSIIAFNNWNSYKANPNKGQRLAFREFQNKIISSGRGKWSFEEYRKFSSISTSFIAQKLNS